MAYINADKAKLIRKKLKEHFPASKGWKLSVRIDNYMALDCCILQAPYKLTDKENGYEQLNPHTVSEREYGHLLQKMVDILNGSFLPENEQNFNNSDPMTDYFHVGWYIHLNVGKWDMPFKHVEAKSKPKPTPVSVDPGKVQVIEYSEKAIAVIGDTKPIKDTLKELGGKFNFRLSCGPGWIFPKTKLEELQTALRK